MQRAHHDPYYIPRLISGLRGGLEWLQETHQSHLELGERGREALALLQQEGRLQRLAQLIEGRVRAERELYERASLTPTAEGSQRAEQRQAAAPPPPPTPLRELPGVTLTTEIWGLDRFSSFEAPPPRLESPPKAVTEVMRPIGRLAERYQLIYEGLERSSEGPPQTTSAAPTEAAPTEAAPTEAAPTEAKSHQTLTASASAPVAPQAFGSWLNRSPARPSAPAQPTAQPLAQPTAQPTAQPLAQPTAQPTAQPMTQPLAQHHPPTPLTQLTPLDSTSTHELAEGAQRWRELELNLSACRACPRSQHRLEHKSSVVMGIGSRSPEVIFVESHPSPLGADSGLPFVGPEVAVHFAKGLLWLKLARHEVYTTSLLKCGSSEPTPAEWQSCRAHFQRELELLRPKVIVALGSLASQILLNRSGPLMGEWSEVAGVPLLCTHHFQDVSHPKAITLKRELAQHLKWLRTRLDSLN